MLHETFLTDLAKLIHSHLPESRIHLNETTNCFYVYDQKYEIQLMDHTERYKLKFKQSGWFGKPKETNKEHISILLMYLGPDKSYNLVIKYNKLVLPETKLTKEAIYHQVYTTLADMGIFHASSQVENCLPA